MTSRTPPMARAAEATERTERESTAGSFSTYRLGSWEEAWPGIVCGVTAAAPEADFSASGLSAWTFLERVERLAEGLDLPAAVWARQVHGAAVRSVDEAPAAGFSSPGEADGLSTARADMLLILTVADCVPVYLLDPTRRAMALLHAGWRGAAAGILECGVELLGESYGSEASDLRLHLGPAICGDCYEVGDEVRKAFGRPADGIRGLDLRDELMAGALAAGVPGSQISRSTWCTRCEADRFHSHRGSLGSAGRMAAFFGWRDPGRRG